MRTRRELVEFVASLPIPADRREIVQMELEDHVFERIAELEAAGLATPEAERRSVEALGDPVRLRAELVDAQLAWSIKTREATFLGIRAGLLIAAISLVTGMYDERTGFAHFSAVTHVQWLEPSPLYYVIAILSLIAVWPKRVIRPFLAAQRHAIEAHRAGNVDAVRRLQEPGASFLGALIFTSSSPFFAWILASALHVPMGPFEGPLLRTLLASFVVNVLTLTLCSVAILQASPESARKRT